MQRSLWCLQSRVLQFLLRVCHPTTEVFQSYQWLQCLQRLTSRFPVSNEQWCQVELGARSVHLCFVGKQHQ
jgi:hypothetical protein